MRDRFDIASETADLDLLPVMNLFMVLIPFLLMGAAFYHIGAIPSALPTHASGEAADEREPIKVMLNLKVSPASLDITASSDRLDDRELAALSASFPMKHGDYRPEDVQAHFRKVKQRYPESDTAMVLPHDGLDYERLVSLLDLAREVRSGTTAQGDPQYQPLFPVVIFSRQLQEPEPPEDGEEAR